MKEQILSLESTDDLQSLRDKITRAQAGRLVLIWPALAEPINRRLDFELLRRWTAMAGSELILVSADREVHRIAAQAGIPCHRNLKETALHGLSRAEKETAAVYSKRPIRPRPPAPGRENFSNALSPQARMGIFSTTILLLVILFLLLIPSARLRVIFPTRAVESSNRLDPAICTPISISYVLSARRETTGFLDVPTAYAQGTVELTNTSTRVLDLPAGLMVSSKSVFFYETTAGVIILPGKAQSVAVRAVKPGPSGNLTAGMVDRVEGPLALSMKVSNPGPMTGGAQARRSAVTQSDLDVLRASLSDQLREEAAAGIQNMANSNRTLVDRSLRVEFDPADSPDFPIAAASDTVGLTLHVAATALACPTDIVRSRAQSLLAAGLAAGETLFPESVTVRLVQDAPGAIGLQASGLVAKIPDRNDMILALRVRTPEQAVAILTTRFGARSVAEMDTRPGWIPVFPLFPYQIGIIAAAE
jgi:hypothetical protein